MYSNIKEDIRQSLILQKAELEHLQGVIESSKKMLEARQRDAETLKVKIKEYESLYELIDEEEVEK